MTSANIVEAEFMIYAAAWNQERTEKFWLTFEEFIMLLIFILKWSVVWNDLSRQP